VKYRVLRGRRKFSSKCPRVRLKKSDCKKLWHVCAHCRSLALNSIEKLAAVNSFAVAQKEVHQKNSGDAQPVLTCYHILGVLRDSVLNPLREHKKLS
jgi:hypothetical protein